MCLGERDALPRRAQTQLTYHEVATSKRALELRAQDDQPADDRPADDRPAGVNSRQDDRPAGVNSRQRVSFLPRSTDCRGAPTGVNCPPPSVCSASTAWPAGPHFGHHPSDIRTLSWISIDRKLASELERSLLLGGTVSRPRQILPGQFYLLTRRCTQRMFLLRPDAATNNAFMYCLAVAAQLFGIDVLYSVAESNHHHTVIFDRHGCVSAFLEYFHKLVARSQNALRGRCENLWASGEPCVTRLLDRAAVIDKLIYAATNPVKDRLVERVHHWPGPQTFAAFAYGREITAKRPAHFFRKAGSMPAQVTLRVTIPAELGPAEEVIREVCEGIDRFERAVATERRRTGAGVIGRRRILSQSWKDSPSSIELRRVCRPRFAGGIDVRIPEIERYRAFLYAYKHAREQWLAGRNVLFPAGTYWLSRFAYVSVEQPNSQPFDPWLNFTSRQPWSSPAASA